MKVFLPWLSLNHVLLLHFVTASRAYITTGIQTTLDRLIMQRDSEIPFPSELSYLGQACYQCLKESSSGTPLQRCSGCSRSYYCSPGTQSNHVEAFFAWLSDVITSACQKVSYNKSTFEICFLPWLHWTICLDTLAATQTSLQGHKNCGNNGWNIYFGTLYDLE